METCEARGNLCLSEIIVDLSNTWIIIKKQLPGLKKQINTLIKQL